MPHSLTWSSVMLAVVLVLSVSPAHPSVIQDGSEKREQGIAHYRQRQIPQAIDALKQALRTNKRDHEAWYFLGLAFLEKDDPKEAVKSFKASIKLQPTFAEANTGLAYSFLLRNKLRDAVNSAEKALKLNSQMPDAHYVIGVVRLRRAQNAAALESAQAAIGINPNFAQAYLLKSKALVNFTGPVLVQPTGSSEERGEIYRKAAEALVTFLKLAPDTNERALWEQQIASLRFWADPPRSPGLYNSRSVTTKPRILRKPEPAYPEAARASQISGTVVLRAVLAADETVKHIILVSGLPNGLTESAIHAASQIKFVPATLDGRPVSFYVQLEYNFNLR